MATEESEFLTLEEFQAQLRARGVDVSATTLRSWRDLRLLPASTRGGIARHSSTAVDQAVVVFELFKIKRDAEYVGWHLWMRGFDVDERFWAPHMKRSGGRAVAIGRKLGRLLVRDKRDPSVGDKLDAEIRDMAKTVVVPRPYSSATRGMTVDSRVRALWVLVQAISGTFVPDPDSKLETDRLGAFQTLIGMRSADNDVILGQRLNVKVGLGDFLRACRDIPEFVVDATLFRGLRLERLKAARDDVWAALGIGVDLYSATEFVYGPRTFGLRVVGFLARGGPAILSSIVVLFAAIRDHENAFLTSAEIKKMRDDARLVLSLSNRLRRLISADPKLQKIMTPEVLKWSLNSVANNAKFGKYVAREYQLQGMISGTNSEPKNVGQTD